MAVTLFEFTILTSMDFFSIIFFRFVLIISFV